MSQAIQKAYTVQHRINVIVSFLRVCDGHFFAYIPHLVNIEGILDSNPQKPRMLGALQTWPPTLPIVNEKRWLSWQGRKISVFLKRGRQELCPPLITATIDKRGV